MSRTIPTTFLLLSLILGASALVEKLEIDSDDRRAFHVESFGYEPDGHFEMLVTEFMLMVAADYQKPTDSKYKIAFVLQRSASDDNIRIDDASGACFHEERMKDADTTIISLESRHDWRRFPYETKITDPGYYHLYFSNCEPNTQVSFTLELTEYNVDPRTRKPVYLSAGESSLPVWYFVVTAAFSVELIVWLAYLRAHREYVRSIHYLMTAVIVLKIMSVFFEAFRYHTLKTTGLHDAWSILFYIFTFLKGMLLFAVIVLIGTGWSYMKPFLTERDKQIMLAVMVVQTAVNVAMVVVDETAPGAASWITWRDILHMLDIICCCLTLLPIVWSIRHLRQAASEDTKDGRAARSMDRLKAFRTFYLLVVSYIYFTRIIVFLLASVLPFEFTWVSNVFSEIAALAFYAITGSLFRPMHQRHAFLRLGADDDDDGALPDAPATASSASGSAELTALKTAV